MKRVSSRSYNLVSLVYNELMKEVDYTGWSKYILNLIEDHVEKRKVNVLEIGAGNCRVTATVSKKFQNYIATDISFPMLKQGSHVSVEKVCCDMTALPFNKKFDIIFSTFDSVNYLLTKRKLLTLFQEVKRVLRNNGIFTFDVSLEKNSLDFEKACVKEGKSGEYSFIRKSKYYPKSRIHKNKFWIKSSDGHVVEEMHKQKIYKFETYFDLINKTGLYVVECLEAFTFNNGNSNCDRIQFVLKIDESKC